VMRLLLRLRGCARRRGPSSLLRRGPRPRDTTIPSSATAPNPPDHQSAHPLTSIPSLSPHHTSPQVSRVSSGGPQGAAAASGGGVRRRREPGGHGGRICTPSDAL
jgi:hypothetical protein